MTAPDTNTERQARRHSPALIGIAIAVLLAIGAGLVMGGWGDVENDSVVEPQTTVQPEAGQDAVQPQAGQQTGG